MGKAEGREEKWHGHVTAVTVAMEYRRLGIAGLLMKGLEELSEMCVLVEDTKHVNVKKSINVNVKRSLP